MSRDLVKITTGLAQKIRPGLPAILKPFGEAIKAARALGPHPTAKERAGLETWLDKLQQAALEHPEVAASCAGQGSGRLTVAGAGVRWRKSAYRVAPSSAAWNVARGR